MSLVFSSRTVIDSYCRERVGSFYLFLFTTVVAVILASSSLYLLRVFLLLLLCFLFFFFFSSDICYIWYMLCSMFFSSDLSMALLVPILYHEIDPRIS